MVKGSQLNFGIIGTGNIAQGGHGKALLETTTSKLVGVYSRDLGRARQYAKAYGASQAYDSLEEMLRSNDIEAVIITSPDKLHFEHASVAARAGKHILLEKPMVTESGQGDELLEICKKHGVMLAVAYHLRHHAGHRQMVAAIRDGAIGRPLHVRVHWSWRSENDSNWRASSDLGRWWSLAGVGTHCLDLARWVLLPSAGEVESLSALASNSIYKGPHDEVAVLTLRFNNGATAEICSSSVFAAPTRFEVYGSDGYFIAEDTLGRHGAGKIVSDKGEVKFTVKNPFAEQLEHFSAAILHGTPVAVDGEEGLRNSAILLEAASRSGFLLVTH